MVLADVATSTHFKHSCTGFGSVFASVAWASVRFFELNYLFLISMHTDQIHTATDYLSEGCN
jgi:hypothetical protein